MKTILTNRGYAIIKQHFNFKDINRTRKELTVSPFINDSYGANSPTFPVYLESPNKIYLPKHYGHETFGIPDKIKHLDKGLDIDLDFNGTLRDTQKNPVELFLKSCEEGPLTQNS